MMGGLIFGAKAFPVQSNCEHWLLALSLEMPDMREAPIIRYVESKSLAVGPMVPAPRHVEDKSPRRPSEHFRNTFQLAKVVSI